MCVCVCVCVCMCVCVCVYVCTNGSLIWTISMHSCIHSKLYVIDTAKPHLCRRKVGHTLCSCKGHYCVA